MHSEAPTNQPQAQHVIALQAEIVTRPTLALCLLEQMLRDFDRSRRSSAGDTFDLSLRSAHDELAKTDENIKDSSAWAAVHAQIDALTMHGPEGDAAVLPWLLNQSHTYLSSCSPCSPALPLTAAKAIPMVKDPGTWTVWAK